MAAARIDHREKIQDPSPRNPCRTDEDGIEHEDGQGDGDEDNDEDEHKNDMRPFAAILFRGFSLVRSPHRAVLAATALVWKGTAVPRIWLRTGLGASFCLGFMMAWSNANVAEGALAQSSDAVAEANVITTNHPPSRLSWQGWDGLHFDLSRRLLIPLPESELPFTTESNVFERIFVGPVQHRGKMGLKLQLDGAAFLADKSLPPFESGAEVRHVRVYAAGEWAMLKPIAYQFELGYVPTQFYMEDTYLALRELAVVGQLKLGDYKTPMGLDQMTSGRDRMFMEPAASIQALTPGANAGLDIGRSLFHQQMTWAFGVFGKGVGSEFGDASDEPARVISRVTGLPWFEQDPERPWSRNLFHLGLSLDSIYSGTGTIRYRSRPESHLAPYVIDTQDIPADNANTLDFEAAWVQGPLSVQGEYLRTLVFQKDAPDLQFQGFYVGASWFLTGESRAYDREAGIFSRVTPRDNFNWKNGTWGALELVGRYSYTDLSDRNVKGGHLSAFTAGVTWYPHSHVHCRFNYVHGSVTDTAQSGRMDIFETRAEIDF